MSKSESETAKEVARVAVEKYLSRSVEPSSINLVNGGSVNKVFDFNDELVIRVGTGVHSLDTFNKENWCIDQARAKRVITPEVFSIDDASPYPAMIQPKIRGTRGVAVEEDGAFKEMWRELGRYAKLIHSVPASGFGDRFWTSHRTSESWEKWVEGQRAALLNDPQIWRGLLGRWQLARIRARFEKLAQLRFEPVLCHANMGERNVIIDREFKVHLLDWGNAGGYPSFWDLAEVIAWNEPGHTSIRCFCQGYEMTDARTPGITRTFVVDTDLALVVQHSLGHGR